MVSAFGATFAATVTIVQRPDWCCEVLSDSTRKTDREVKMPLYAQAGVEWIWLVDPDARRLEVLRVRAGAAELVESLDGAVKRAIAPFESVVDTGGWWIDMPAGT